MKAQMSEAALLGAAKSVLNGVTRSTSIATTSTTTTTSNGRVAKKSSKDAATTEEMQIYFSKLKELVPFMPRHRKLSKLEIIQYVIDYICDLQLALEETHPAATTTTTTTTVVMTSPATSRQPLANVISNVVTTSPATVSTNSSSSLAATGNSVSNTCAAQEAYKLDQLPSRLDDLNTRPVSC